MTNTNEWGKYHWAVQKSISCRYLLWVLQCVTYVFLFAVSGMKMQVCEARTRRLLIVPLVLVQVVTRGCCGALKVLTC